MRITSFDIERFGIWEDLHLPKISKGLNLFYGPNEAGKTTLLQFLRSGLYGCGVGERAGYIRMALGGNPSVHKDSVSSVLEHSDSDHSHLVGGSMSLRTEFGEYRVDRRYMLRNTTIYDRKSALEARSGFVADGGLAQWSGRFYPIQGTGIAESLIVTGPDGARLSDYFVKTLTGNVDEATYNNIFAIGLDELQRLGTLNETDAAQMLYRLSVGIDRVSLIQVLHQLVDERNEILDIKGGPSILEGLFAQRQRLRAEEQAPAILMRDYVKTIEQRSETESELSKIESLLERHRRAARLYELAMKLIPDWDRRGQLLDKISSNGSIQEVDDKALVEARNIENEYNGFLQQASDVKQTILGLRKEYEGVQYSDVVRENCPRIDLLGEGLPRIQEVTEEIKEKEQSLSELQDDLATEEERLKGVKRGYVSSDDGTVERPIDYRSLARAVRVTTKRVKQVQSLSTEAERRLSDLAQKVDQELSSRGQKTLQEALETTSFQIKKLRRRMELSRRLTEADKAHRDLAAQNEHLVANQTLPLPFTLGIAAAVAIGALFAVLSFLGKENVTFGSGILGLAVAIAGVAYKTTTEKKNYAALTENQKRLSHLARQMNEMKQEAGAIDAEIPAAGLTIDVRIQKAEADMAVFERLVPTEAKWRETAQHAKNLAKRLENSLNAQQKAKKRWTDWLKSVSLPETYDAAQVKALLERADVAEALRRQIETTTGEIDLLRRERSAFTDQLDHLFTITQILPPADPSLEVQFQSLRDAADAVLGALQQRSEIRQKMAVRRRERRELIDQAHQKKLELIDFLSFFDAKTTQELERQSQRWKDHSALVAQLTETREKIAAAVNGFCEESEIDPILSDEAFRLELPARKQESEDLIAQLEMDRTRKEQLVGRLSEQLEGMAARKDSVRNRFDRAALDLRIDRMAALWRSRAVSCKMMEEIRKSYEKERQPETLREASRLMRRLTDGRYVKIWTPLGEDTLYIDTDDGESLEVASLSRGLREQLFIAIRLALTGTFEKHGINLPMVFDDVLVNFDNRRALRAAKLMLEFAEAGRQIFLFTCHEHICRIFLDLGMPVFVLPERSQKVKRFRVLLPENLQKKEPVSAVSAPTPSVPETTKALPRKVIPYIESFRGGLNRDYVDPAIAPASAVQPVTIVLRSQNASRSFEVEEKDEPLPEPVAVETPEPEMAKEEPLSNGVDEVKEEILPDVKDDDEPVKPEALSVDSSDEEGSFPEEDDAPSREPTTEEPSEEEAAEEVEPPQEAAPPAQSPEEVLERHFATDPKEEEVDRLRRSPIEFSSWRDLFSREEEESLPEESAEEEPEETPESTARDDAYIPEDIDHIFDSH